MNDLDRDVDELRSFINNEFLTAEGTRTWSPDQLNAALDRLEARIQQLEAALREAGEALELARTKAERRVFELAYQRFRNALSRTNDTPPQHKEG